MRKCNFLFVSFANKKNETNLRIQSDGNISIRARDDAGNIVNQMLIGDSKIQAITNQFSLKNLNGQTLFLVDDQHFAIMADVIKIDSELI
jgi:hypothetical protein